MGIGEPRIPQPGRSAAPRPQHNAPAGTGATWRGLTVGRAWPSPLGPHALVRPPALTVAELQQRGRVVQAAVTGEAVLHAEAGPRPLRPRSPTHCALPSRRGAGAGAGPAVAAAGHHGNPGPPPPQPPPPLKTSTRRAAREGAASVAWPGGDVAGGVLSWARLGPAWVLPGSPPWSPPWSLPLGWQDRMLREGEGDKGLEGKGRLQPFPGPRGTSCPPSVPYALSLRPRAAATPNTRCIGACHWQSASLRATSSKACPNLVCKFSISTLAPQGDQRCRKRILHSPSPVTSLYDAVSLD